VTKHGDVLKNMMANMYTEPPTNIISLHEFYKLALDRLQVLKKIEFMYDANADKTKISEEVIRLTVQHQFAISVGAKSVIIKPEDKE